MGIRQIIITLVAAAILCGSSRAQPVEQIEVVAQTAKVKVAGEVISTVGQGARFEVLEREGPWVAVSVTTDSGPRTGWILGSQVRTVAEGIDDDTPAPPVPQTVSATVNWTQTFTGYPGSIFFELTLRNGGRRAVPYDAAEFSLLVDGKPMREISSRMAVRHAENIAGRRAVAGNHPFRSATDVTHLSYLTAGSLPPGEKVSGWMAFAAPAFERLEEVASLDWKLSGEVDGQAIEIDLRQLELQAMGDTVRPSALEPSVPVIEIGGRVNALNLGKLLETIDALAKSGQAAVILCTTSDLVVDQPARNWLGLFALRTRGAGGMAPVWANLPRGLQNMPYADGSGPPAASEAAAVIEVLARGPGHVEKLKTLLADADPEIRAAAARGLGKYIGDTSVVEAVARTAADVDKTVRIAAITSLGPADDARAAEAIIAAVDDPDTRYTAVVAAANQKSAAVVPPLVKMLEGEANVAMAACRSLGKLKAEAAAEGLRRLESHPNRSVAMAALDALQQIGAVTAADAALARLKAGYPRENEVAALIHLERERALPALLAGLRSGPSEHTLGIIARALGELGDARAVEPLLTLIEYNPKIPGDVFRTLGKLGDRRAVEPLRTALAAPSRQPPERLAIREALLKLGEPGICEQLAEELRQVSEHQQAESIIRALGRSGGNEAIPVVAPYLDDARLYRAAALALLDIGSREAIAPLVERLLSADYKYSGNVVTVLSGPVFTRSLRPRSADWDQRFVEVLRALAASGGGVDREKVAHFYAVIDQRLVAQELAEFRLYLENRRFDDAERAFRSGLERQLDRLARSPEPAAFLPGWFGQALEAIVAADGMERGSRFAREAIGVVNERLEKEGTVEHMAVSRQFHVAWLSQRLKAGEAVENAEFHDFFDRYRDEVVSSAGRGLTDQELNAMASLAERLEFNGRLDLAAALFRTLASVVAETADRSWLPSSKNYEGAIRRLELPGKPIEIEGDTIDGSPLDWTRYRGKVVLVGFWSMASEASRADMAHAKALHERYRQRGFDVVGIGLGQDRGTLEQFLEQNSLPWATLYDGQDANWHPSAVRYGITRIPAAFLVDRQGNVVSVRAQGDELERQLVRLLGPAEGGDTRIDLDGSTISALPNPAL